MNPHLDYDARRAEVLAWDAVRADMRRRLREAKAPVIVPRPPQVEAQEEPDVLDARGFLLAMALGVTFWALVIWLVWQAGS